MKLWLLLLTITTTLARQKKAKAGYNRLKLSPSIVLEWRVDYSSMEAEMRVRARLGPRDWLGIGFSDYGAVQGADLCIVFKDWRGRVEVKDTQVDNDSLVEVDKQQDCTRQGEHSTNRHCATMVLRRHLCSNRYNWDGFIFLVE